MNAIRMNANRMYSLAVAAVLCCAPAYAQLGTSNGAATAQTGSPQRGADRASRDAQTPDGTAAAGATNDPTTQTSPAQDKIFVKKALEGSMAEVQLGQLALQKSNDEQVKQFAQQMVDDHTKLIDDMKPLAEKMGVAVPSSPSKMEMKTMDKLKTLNGDAFDQAYIKDMVKDHKADSAEFNHEAGATQNAELRQTVENGDKVIEMHLQHIEQIAKSKSGTSSKAKGTR